MEKENDSQVSEKDIKKVINLSHWTRRGVASFAGLIVGTGAHFFSHPEFQLDYYLPVLSTILLVTWTGSKLTESLKGSEKNLQSSYKRISDENAK